jgi:DNA-binding response OmpR family regulator
MIYMSNDPGSDEMNETILVVEDDPAILTGLTDLLEIEGYKTDSASDGESALERFRSALPDLVLLDVMIPKKNGYDVCREIRSEDRLTPILMLTAKGEEIDKVVGLELGADDYIVKPFGAAELLARVRSALRRSSLVRGGLGKNAGVIDMDGVIVDLDGMTCRKGGETCPLTPKETAILRRLAASEGAVVSRESLIEAVWGINEGCGITTRTVDQHMVRLRQKIERDPSHPAFLHTVHGAGYKFESRGYRSE